ncbi:MAG: hypothetical protein ACI9OU_000454 [Candidatus Promineifilaceae bacterium]|jgi:hypothetical protein
MKTDELETLLVRGAKAPADLSAEQRAKTRQAAEAILAERRLSVSASQPQKTRTLHFSPVGIGLAAAAALAVFVLRLDLGDDVQSLVYEVAVVEAPIVERLVPQRDVVYPPLPPISRPADMEIVSAQKNLEQDMYNFRRSNEPPLPPGFERRATQLMTRIQEAMAQLESEIGDLKRGLEPSQGNLKARTSLNTFGKI